jgi:quinol monooxygenase YgiN
MLVPLIMQREALQILESVIAQIQTDPGCIHCLLYRGVDDVRAIMLDELWAEEDNLIRHLRSELFRRVLLAIEMAEEPPEVRFEKISQTSGIETIEKARTPH